MDIDSISSLSSMAKIDKASSLSAPTFTEAVDTISLTKGSQETEKISKWVEMLNSMEMPKTIHSAAEEDLQASVQNVIAKRLAQEVGSFLLEGP